MKKGKYQLVVDECAAAEAVEAFTAYAKSRNLGYSSILYVKENHRGIPDNKIISNLLNSSTLFLTVDRVAHNLALKAEMKSFYYSDGKIKDRMLPNIDLPKTAEVIHKDKLFDNSFLDSSPIRNLVLPEGEKPLKSLTTKRRRIRAHFGGFDQLKDVAVTISWDKFQGQTLFGFQIQANSKIDMPAIMASESYIVDEAPPELQQHSAICYAMILLMRLSLQSLPVKLYFDSKPGGQSGGEKGGEKGGESGGATMFSGYAHLPDAACQKFFERLKKEFANVEFIGVSSGPHMVKLRKKLFQLKGSPSSNELMAEDITEIRAKVLAYRPGAKVVPTIRG